MRSSSSRRTVVESIIDRIITLCEHGGIDPSALFAYLLARIEIVGAEEASNELRALSELRSRRAGFLKQLKVREWVMREIGHDRYTFTDIDQLAGYRNRLMLIEYKQIGSTNTGNADRMTAATATDTATAATTINPYRLLTPGQRITYNYLHRLLLAGSRMISDAVYEGFYLIALDDMDIYRAGRILINGTEVTKEELRDFLSFRSSNRYKSLFSF